MGLLVVVGYGPGISHAAAERFGREGYDIALIGRSSERLAEGVARLASSGIAARAHPADASDPEALRGALRAARDESGPVEVLLWTAFRGGDVRDVLSIPPEDLERVFDIGVRGLLTAVQTVLDDLKASGDGAVLVANGALGEASSEADRFAVHLGSDGVALENAAKTKLVGLLAERLRPHGIRVGEITIAGSVAGTPTASPTAIEPSAIADRFWSMRLGGEPTRVRMTE